MIIKISPVVLSLFVMTVLAGCASTNVTDRQIYVNENEILPRPNRILVYDFGATSANVPSSSAFAGELTGNSIPKTDEQIAIANQVGSEIASELVSQITAMGLPAYRASTGTTPQINDYVIRGYLVSVVEGSAGERMALGFGAGSSELKTLVEGFQMTAQGLQKLGSGTVDSSGSKSPGAALGIAGVIATGNPVGLIVSSGMKVYGEKSGSSTITGRAKQTAKEIANEIRPRFVKQGWIQ